MIFNRHSFCVNPQMLVHIPHLSEVNPHFYWDNPQLRAINPHFSLDHTQTLKMPEFLPLAVPVPDVRVLRTPLHVSMHTNTMCLQCYFRQSQSAY